MKKYEWPGKKILIVEDEESNARLLEITLKHTKAEISHVYTGPDAIRHIAENQDTDLILMDINIPEKDGLMVTAEIKKTNPEIFIIAQSAYVGVIKQSHVERVGADDFIAKPINHDELFSKIDFYLNK